MPETTSTTIGFIGLGHMGAAMAGHLLDAGYRVCGTSRTPERAHHLLAAGLQWYDTPRAVAENSAVVITSIPDDSALEAVASGPDGVLTGLRAGQLWVEMSTVSPQASRALALRVATRGAAMVDAPVSGSVPQVQAGTLTIMVGGDEHAYARAEPVLRHLGTPTHVGANGQGLALKLAINISLAGQILALSEGLVLAERSGVDRKLALRLMTESPIGSPMLKARAPLVLDLPAEAWFDIRMLRKDIELALDAAAGLDIPLPAADRAAEILAVAHDLGYDRRDIAAVYEVLQRMATQPAKG